MNKKVVYQFFSQVDFDRCNPACDISDMDVDFMKKLDIARRASNLPYMPTSAYRSKEHELEMGRNGSSSHTKGLAVDLMAVSSRQRFLVLKGLIEAGFTRIGLGENFLHVDMDSEKSQYVAWNYYE